MAATVTSSRASAGSSAQQLAAPRAPAPADSRAAAFEPFAGAPEPSDALPARSPATASILLVDDDQDSLRALGAVLEPLGQRLLTACSGEEALRRLLHEEFAVILLDLRMPGLDGLETASYINARARTRHTPIIFLTAHAQDVEQVFRAYAAGAVDYVVKPFDPDVLRSKVAVFVELQHERAARVREARARVEAEAVAHTLQRHLLPDRLPRVTGLAMGARYRPSERIAQVGGDWYDAIGLPGGRVGLVIGDVVGHGVRAATLMGELRAALRAYALLEPDFPGAVLGRLNTLVAATHSARMVATLLYMVMNPGGGGIRFASAGHLPPLLMEADGSTRFLRHDSALPLGAAEHTVFGDYEGELSPGSTVLLYTDGLVERRGETIDVGLERLREVLSTGSEDLEELCSHVIDRAPSGVGARDDMALLAVRLLKEDAERLEVVLPAEPGSVSVARYRVDRWLAQTGGGHGNAFAIKLAVSEVCANAVEHAYGPESGHTFRLLAERAGGDVVIEVSDSGRWRRPRGSQRGLGLRLIEQLMDTVDVERAPAGTTVRMRKATNGDGRL
ncbi:MAG TPA: SpoIIE family protein phosphatase [Solirubrobacteraceae bacterium]|jgi:serine phosphatase RsbU (regulator of sigma subunit)/anti-sigma regulatory factor (Ser/Thr protein kinase)|nr:SpoIIE family protein phosphatase [Solirubrobacteraceae bacterium]